MSIENEKVAINGEKVAFERRLSEVAANAPTKNKARLLFDFYGSNGIFGRAEIMQMFGMASSSLRSDQMEIRRDTYFQQLILTRTSRNPNFATLRRKSLVSA